MISEVDWIDNGGALDLMVEEVGGLPVLRVEESLVLELRSIEKLMCELAGSKGFLFSSCTHQRDRIKIKAERLGRNFVNELKRKKGKFERCFPSHEVNPYVEVFSNVLIESMIFIHSKTGLRYAMEQLRLF